MRLWFKWSGRYWAMNSVGRVENRFRDFEDDGDNMGEWCHSRDRCGVGGGLFWCVASVNLKGIAALSPAVIFFKFVLISWFLQNLSVLTSQFCSLPGHPSTIYIKFKSPFLNILPSSAGSHWDKIQVMIWRQKYICTHAVPCLFLFGFISLVVGKLYSRMFSSDMCDMHAWGVLMMIRNFKLKMDFKLFLFFFCLRVSKGVEKLLLSTDCQLWLYAELCLRAYVHACVRMCVRACIRTCVHACICTCMCSCVHTCACLPLPTRRLAVTLRATGSVIFSGLWKRKEKSGWRNYFSFTWALGI